MDRHYHPYSFILSNSCKNCKNKNMHNMYACSSQISWCWLIILLMKANIWTSRTLWYWPKWWAAWIAWWKATEIQSHLDSLSRDPEFILLLILEPGHQYPQSKDTKWWWKEESAVASSLVSPGQATQTVWWLLDCLCPPSLVAYLWTRS